MEKDHSSSSPLETTSDDRSSSNNSLSESVSPSSSDQSHVFTLTTSENGDHRKTTGGSFAYRVREHVKMGPNFSETVLGKLSVGVKIIKKGGRENIFKDMFGLIDGEKLLKASQCYLSTTQGPIAGILFISTDKVAFCSERSIRLHSSSSGGEGGGITTTKIPYKLTIPVKKIKKANESENMDNPAHKYIHIVTHDEFEFWFMGFVRYEKAFINLQKAVSLCR